MSNVKNKPMTEGARVFDLEERTGVFGESIVCFAKRILVTSVTQRLIPQLVAAGTSVGANYCEADNAESSRDFRHKIGIAKKEAREAMHFLRMVAVAAPEMSDDARALWKEAKELNLIFAAIIRSVDGNRRKKVEETIPNDE